MLKKIMNVPRQVFTSTGSFIQASLAHNAKEWQMHFTMKIPGQRSFNRLATESLAPIMVLQPSDPKPIMFSKLVF